MQFSVLIVLFALFYSSCAQWNAQQMEAYRQQYYQWYQQQQQVQQQQQPQPQAQAAPHPIWGHAQSDDKGNYWHGNDHAKIMLIARSSYP